MPGQATIVLAGTNDVLTGTPLSQLRQDAERLYRATPGRVLAIGVPPLVGMEDHAAAVNAVLQEAADAAVVEWWDPTEALSSPGKRRRDGVHLTGRGYEATRERIATPTDVSRSLAFDP
ncbi:SGNH/GDSL hydrolase family protein [Micrococcus luteus]|uniref:SGNH/GDSL hydrolase family protein n=1 Tax=Micrococcus luteus TaxID=1270 RepID=UPI003980BDD1